MAKRIALPHEAVYLCDTRYMFPMMGNYLKDVCGYIPLSGDGKGVRGSGWMYAEGDIPMLLVAHVDTTYHRTPIKRDICFWRDHFMAPDVGLGADDRAGIAAIVEVLQRGFRPHILLLDGEEQGGVGARTCVQQIPNPPKVRGMIELDRAHHDDAVFYFCSNHAWARWVLGFKWKEEKGAFTDISILGPAWRLASVNLSVGYTNQHTLFDRLCLSAWHRTCDRLVEMLKTPPAEAMEHSTFVYTPPAVGNGNYFDALDGYGDGNGYKGYRGGVAFISLQLAALRVSTLLGGTEEQWRGVIAKNYREIEDRLMLEAFSILASEYHPDPAAMKAKEEEVENAPAGG